MSDSVSTPNNTPPLQVGDAVEKRLAPTWIFKVMNPVMMGLLRSRWHRLMSGILMLITYRGRKSGKWYTNPIGYFDWDKDELLSATSARWWVNVLDGNPVTLLVKGQWLKAVPTVINDQEAIIKTLEEVVKRLGWKTVRRMQVPLPDDREPTLDDLRAVPPGRIFVHFKIVENA